MPYTILFYTKLFSPLSRALPLPENVERFYNVVKKLSKGIQKHIKFVFGHVFSPFDAFFFLISRCGTGQNNITPATRVMWRFAYATLCLKHSLRSMPSLPLPKESMRLRGEKICYFGGPRNMSRPRANLFSVFFGLRHQT